MKRWLLIILVILFTLLLIGVGLYYFRNPKWENTYSSSDNKYIEKYLYEINDGKWAGTIWVDSISYEDNNNVFYLPENIEGKRPSLVLNSGGRVNQEINLTTVIKEAPSPMYLYITTEKEGKNYLDEILCSYLRGNFCNRNIEIASWELYANTYPYPNLSAEQSIKVVSNSLYTLSNLITDGTFKGIDYDQGYELLKEIYITRILNKEVDKKVEDYYNYNLFGFSYLFIDMFNPEDNLYKYMLDDLCVKVSPMYELDNDSSYKETTVSYLRKIKLNEKCEKQLIVDKSVLNLEPVDIKAVEYREYIISALRLSILGENIDKDAYKEVINDFVSSGYLTSVNTPICMGVNVNQLCSNELIYLMLIYLHYDSIVI